MLDEDDLARASYLAALRQPKASPSSAAAPAPAAEIPALGATHATEKQFTQVRITFPEKRRSPRYKCTGSVRLQESTDAAPVWAAFTDISLSGCYVESATPFPKGARIELKLQVNDFHIETKGEVRVPYPGLGMGIVFTAMSEAERSRLRELIESIAGPAIVMGRRVTPELASNAPGEPPSMANPTAALRAMVAFFENRHMMGREEFLRILRESQ